MIEIKKANESDWDQIWEIVHEVFLKGDTYPYSPNTSKVEAHEIWMNSPKATYAAIEADQIVGTYYIKPNQPDLGSHICNAGYMVSLNARGKSVGKLMCEHSLKEAVKLGFQAMQYNLVISCNVNAIKLWENMGFRIVGTIPGAFNHSEKGLVDAHIMFKKLIE